MKLSLLVRGLSVSALALAVACSSGSHDATAPADPSVDQTAPQADGPLPPEAAYDNTPSTDVDRTIQISAAELALSPDLVRAPHGGIHPSCLHELGDGDVVDTDGSIKSADGHVQTFAPCAFPVHKVHADAPVAPENGVQPPTDNGWTEDANWTSPVPVQRFSAQFHVPAAPSVYTNQLIYMFPAIEDVAGTSIVQPVLQYGNNGAWGGNYWTIASWLGGGQWGGHYYYSAARRVTTGEVISGAMYDTRQCHPAGCQWAVSMHNSKNTANLTVYAIAGISWRWVFGGAIEVYGINSCRKYPATYDNFFSFAITDYAGHRHTPTWRPSINVHTCGERITSNSSIVNLYY